MVTYKARNLKFPGDEKIRRSTQTGKRYCGGDNDGLAAVALDHDTMRVKKS
jgi:hypothetical protein